MSSSRPDVPGWSPQSTGPASMAPAPRVQPLAAQRRGDQDGLFTTVRDPRGPLAGVCEGIGRRYQVDPLLVRVAFGLLALSVGIGLALYATAALFMPTPEGDRLAYRWMPGTRHWSSTLIWWATAGLCVAALPVSGSISPAGPMPAIVLGIVWLWARRWQRRRRSRQFDWQMAAPAELDAASLAWQARLREVYQHPNPAPTPTVTLPLPATAQPPAGAPPAATARPPAAIGARQPRPLTTTAARPAARRVGPSWAATGVMILLLAAASSLTAIWSPGSPTAQFAILLGVVAGCLLIGAFWRRPRLAVPLGLVLAVLLAGSIAFPSFAPEGPAGTQVYSASRPVPHALTITLRETTLDLRDLPVDADRTIDLTVNASDVTVVLPGNAIVQYTIRAGSVITPDGQSVTESGTHHSIAFPGEPVMTIRITVTAAEVTLR